MTIINTPTTFSSTNSDHQYSSLSGNINFKLLNVCGLSSKISNPEFIELINANDFIFLTETKLDNYDIPNINIDGYTLIHLQK